MMPKFLGNQTWWDLVPFAETKWKGPVFERKVIGLVWSN